jgi:hypothetical protein
MLINIPVKFHDFRSNTFRVMCDTSWVTCDTSWKLQMFTKSRAITLKILHKSTRKYPGAQLHMLINIPVNFHDSRSNTFWVTCDTKENGRTEGWTRVNRPTDRRPKSPLICRGVTKSEGNFYTIRTMMLVCVARQQLK